MSHKPSGSIPYVGATAGPVDASEYNEQLTQAQSAWGNEKAYKQPDWTSRPRRASVDSTSSRPVSSLSTGKRRNSFAHARMSTDSYATDEPDHDYGLTAEEEEEGPVVIPAGYTVEDRDFQETRASVRTDFGENYRKQMKHKLKVPPLPLKTEFGNGSSYAAAEQQKKQRMASDCTQLPSPPPPLHFRPADGRFEQAGALEDGQSGQKVLEKPRASSQKQRTTFLQKATGFCKDTVSAGTPAGDQDSITIRAFLRSRRHDRKFLAIAALLIILFIVFFFLAVTR